MESDGNLFERMRDFLFDLWVLDTHEHTELEEDWLKTPDGLCDFSRIVSAYVPTDLRSAGSPYEFWERIYSADTPLDEKWELFELHWNKARNTGVSRAALIIVRDIFGLPDLNRETYRELSRKVLESRRPGWYRTVLKDKAKIRKCILDRNAPAPDPEFFVPTVRLDPFVGACSSEGIEECEKWSEAAINSFSDLDAAMEKIFRRRLGEGIKAVKIGVAYTRTLKFEKPSRADAERSFDCMMSGDESAAKPMQDYLMHRVVDMATEAGLPVQIHTGIQDGNGNYLDNANPLHLTDLIMSHPKARFDLFHAGYPFTGELGMLAKMFPGVYADLCWMHAISPSAARNALSEWLDIVPASKIFGFGGDYSYVEGAYAHAVMARENTARVLASKVSEGAFSESDARIIASMIMNDNAVEFFGI